MQTANNNNNRSLIKSAIERTVVRLKETTLQEEVQEDVTRVEYDIINYASPTTAATSPRLAVTPRPRLPPSVTAQRSSRLNNNNNSSNTAALESSHVAVVDARSALLDNATEAEPTDTTNRSRGGGALHSRLRKPQASVPARSSAAPTSSTPSPCSTLGVNMRVTGQCSQGGRKYMEDQFSVAYQESPLTHELEYAFFGIYDGHGGNEAALFAKEHLMLEIVKQKQFWSDQDEDVLRAIREGYIATHFAMWREQEKWPRTANGHLSTAGTTATVAFMRREKIYIGHVGDSGIVLGYQNKNERHWRAKQLTTDHKPESLTEKTRIQRAGGNVAIKSGVPRVVWNRPRDPMHRGPIRRRTLVDDIPFLAVARSLGDLWSYNSRCKEFVVSPDPDVKVVKIDPKTFRCLIFGTDGLWNVVTPQEAVDSVRKKHLIGEILNEQDVMNPSKALVDEALKTWAAKKMRADNTSVVTVILTPAATAAAAAAAANQSPISEVDMDILLEAETDATEEENSCPMELSIEEEEFVHDMPYSALAKRHLPPEPYRNFDYYGLEADEEDDVEEEEDATDDDDDEEDEAQRLQQSLSSHRKIWRKSLVQASNATWKEEEVELEVEMEEAAAKMFSHTSIDSGAIYAQANPLVEQHLDYSFAESYNCLLNEQEARSRSAAAEAAAAAAAGRTSGAGPGGAMDVHSLQEILQEQQRYQQQEGYSLTQLETRREQLQQLNEQPPPPPWTASQPSPGELLELNALLQQEREVEEQVAREQMEATSSSSSTTWLMSEQPAQPPPPPTPPTLQDNEVSSTLPALSQHIQEAVADIRKEDAQAVHYIFEQIHKLQQVDCTPAAATPSVGEALAQANSLAESPRIRHLRRYRNVPNENHHCRQIFKPGKGKSFISASAAAIVAYSERAKGAEVSTSPSSSSSPSASNATSNVNRRRQIKVVATGSASSMVMTRRSHSLASTGISKRQLRSSICQLDLTKRTLRTRNVTAVASSSSNSSGGTASNTSRRLRRSNEEREQRRSLRRASQLPSNCAGAMSARPPPSPKKLNAVVPTLAIGTRAYTAALAAAADHLNKRWSLRSSSSSSSQQATRGSSNPSLNSVAHNSLMSAISCYSNRSRNNATTGAANGQTRRR